MQETKTRSRATSRCWPCLRPLRCERASRPVRIEASRGGALGDRVEPHEGVEAVADPEASDRVPQVGGMSLHADVAVPAHDRRRLERLCRYVARPPLASERLEERPDGRLTLRLKTRWRDGTTHILMERSELIERLVPLIPPPRAHQVRYHGVLAPSASMRDRIVPQQTARSPGGASTESVPSSRAQATGGSRMDPNLLHRATRGVGPAGAPVISPARRGCRPSRATRSSPASMASAHVRAGCAGPPCSSASSRWTRFDAPAAAQRCVSSPPSKTPTSPGASSSACDSRRARRLWARRPTNATSPQPER